MLITIWRIPHRYTNSRLFLGFLVISFSSKKRGPKEERKTCKPSFELRNINGSTPYDYSNLVEPKANLDLTSQVPVSVGMCCCRTSGSHGEWVPCRVALLHCHDSHDCPTLRIHTHNNNSFTQIFRSSLNKCILQYKTFAKQQHTRLCTAQQQHRTSQNWTHLHVSCITTFWTQNKEVDTFAAAPEYHVVWRLSWV
jgi:hypothetical protein